MLVVIAALVTIVAIQFASTATSSPKRSQVTLPQRVARLEKAMKVANKNINTLIGVVNCLQLAGITRYPAATLPSGGYLDATPQGGQANAIFVAFDPKCLQQSGAGAKLKQLRIR